MQESSEGQAATNEKDDLTAMLNASLQAWLGTMTSISKAGEAGRDQVARWLCKMTPIEQARIVRVMSWALRQVYDERNIETIAPLLPALKMVGEIINTTSSLAEYYFWQGQLERVENRLEAAIDHYEKAVIGLQDPQTLTEALYNLAMIWFGTGNLVKAELLFQRIIGIAKENSLTQAMGYGYVGLADVARVRNDIAEAISDLERAQEYCRKANDPELTALIMNQQGLIYAQSGNLLRAQEYYQQLEVYLQSAGLPEEFLKRARSSLMLNMARLAEHRKREMQQQLEEQALEEQALQAEIEKVRNITRNARQYAVKALEDQPVLSGIEQVENLAIASRILFSNSDGIGELPLVTQRLLSAFRRAEEIKYAGGVLMIGELLAIIYGLRGYFEPAHRVCAAAIDALEQERSQVGDETDRLHYIQYREDIYGRIVLLCLILRQVKHVSDYQHQAFFYTERAKSRTLIELLGRTASTTPPANFPIELLHEEKQVLDQIRTLEIGLRSAMKKTEREQMERAYAQAQIKLEEIWKQVANIAPEYAALRRGQPITFHGVRELLRV